MLGVSTEEGEDCSRWKGRRQKKSMLEKSCWYFTETTALALAASFLLTNADNKLFPIRNLCFWWTWTNEQLVTLVAVLSDKHKRTIYDTYGEKGLETEGLEVGQSSSSSPFESLWMLSKSESCLPARRPLFSPGPVGGFTAFPSALPPATMSGIEKHCWLGSVEDRSGVWGPVLEGADGTMHFCDFTAVLPWYGKRQ